MVLDVWNYLKGYVIIEVEGFSVERFINLAVHKGVYLWNIKRKKQVVQMHVSLKGYELLRECAKKTLCKITILNQKGFPVFMKKYKTRKLFFLGTLIFLVLLYVLSSYIWDIDIYGNQKLTDLQVLQALDKQGLYVGKYKRKLDPNEIEQKVIKEFREIAWISIGIQGTKAIVKITETTPKPSAVDRTSPSDVVASKDGIVQGIVVQSGELKVEKDIVVKKGDILISGSIPMADETTKLVHASGEITAKVWYRAQGMAPLETTIGKRTGVHKKQYEIKLGKKYLKLHRNGILFKNYDKIVDRKQLQIGQHFAFPVEWITNSYYEKKNTKIKVKKEVAEKNAFLKGMQKLQAQMPIESKVLQTDVQYEEKDGNIIAKITLVNLERIDEKKKIENRGNEIEQTD